MINNTPPVLADVYLSPETAYEGDTLTCTPGDVEDDDGTTSFTYSYAWTVNGSPAGTDSVLVAALETDDEAVCTVTPFDGAAAMTRINALAEKGRLDDAARDEEGVSSGAVASHTFLQLWSVEGRIHSNEEQEEQHGVTSETLP